MVRGRAIRWTNVARVAAVAGAVTSSALLGPGLLRSPKPPPLAADIGLPPATPAGAHHKPASDKEHTDAREPDTQPRRHHGAGAAVESAAEKPAAGTSDEVADQAAEPAAPSAPEPGDTAGEAEDVGGVIPAAPVPAATPAPPPAPSDDRDPGGPPEFGFEH